MPAVHHILPCSCVMIVKKAFVQATLLWVAGLIFTLAFSRWEAFSQAVQCNDGSCAMARDKCSTPN